MNELVVIVEGTTEQTFVRDQLAAHLALHNTKAWPVLSGRHRRHGGVKKWDSTSRDIVRTLKEGRYCSTMFDFYGLPEDWPGRVEAAARPWHERAVLVEERLHQEVVNLMGGKFNPKFFIPYIQLHEFEALAFADVSILASVVSAVSGHGAELLAARFATVVNAAGEPEAIDDGYETCPSRRIAGVVPAYRKGAHGPIITNRIGIDALRARCPHFGNWLHRLEDLGAAGA